MGIDTQLHVKSRNQDSKRVAMLERKLTMIEHSGSITKEAEQVRRELDQMEEDRAAQSEDFPLFQLIPKEMLVSKGKTLKLLPNDLGQWHKKVPQDNPVQALKLAKQIAVAVYEGARKLGGDVAPVLVPPRILLEDPEVRSKLLWENMQLVEPWQNEEVGDEVFTMNPTFLPRDRLSATQQAVCCEMQKQVEMCEFVYYWSREGWCLELLEELRGGFS